jgi:hypothetical protein
MALALALAVLSAACGGGGSGSPPPPPPPPVTVAVAPAAQNVLLGATQTFTATVTNATSTSVTWSVNGITNGNSTVGTIDANGLYRGPAILPSPAAVTIRAISVSSPTSSGTATVTVTSDVVVSITAQSATVEVGAAQQISKSIASTGNGADQNVTWAVAGNGCSGAACGTINSVSGLFTAPGILPSTPNRDVTVTATSVADPTKSATLTLHITANFGFTITGPASGTIDNAVSFQFVPNFTPVPNSNPSTAVSWRVDPALPGGCVGTACGTIDQAGLYTAPNSAPSPPQVTISAMPLADPSKAQPVTVTINSIVLVAMIPASLSIEIEGQQLFTANVGGPQGTSPNVTWSITGPGCSNPGTPCGQLSVSPGQVVVGSVPVIYTAPITIPSGGIGPVTITATSAQDITKSASTTLTFFSTISASLQPSGSTRAVDHRLTLFGGLLRTSTGTPPVDNAVDWTVIDNLGNRIPGGNSTVGQICTVALIGCTSPGSPAAGNPQGDVDYVTPASIPPGQTVSIEMRSQADTSKFTTATVTVAANVTVNVSPSTSTLPVSGTQQFSANVLGAANQSVTWSVNGIPGGNATVGTISTSGLYTAPATAPGASVTVTAASVDDPSQSGSGTITIATGAFITKISPASITALCTQVPASCAQASTDFTLKVQGISFVSSTPGPGSVIVLYNAVLPTVFDGQGGRPGTTCTTTQCTALVRASDVNTPSNGFLVQLQNPGNPVTFSNSVPLVVLDAATQRKDINDATVPVVTLTTASPSQGCNDPPLPTDPGCQNISVVEPTTAGSLNEHYNIDQIGIVLGGVCNFRGTGVTFPRPTNVDICVRNNTTGPSLLASDTFTISGPSPNDITIQSVTAFGGGGSIIQITLQIGSASMVGPRTLFVENKNREKAALVGGIEVK